MSELLTSEHVLRDGTRVRVRPVRPDDARTLQDGFARLSPESRRRRFRGPKRRLSDEELRFLTECDGRRHVALGAVRLDGDGWECEGLGIARYVCLPDHDDVAEPSLTIVDSAQGLGLGRVLAERLTAAAVANGVRCFRAFFLDEHEWLRDRFRRSYPDARLTRRGPYLGADFPLPSLGAAPETGRASGRDRFSNLLRWLAQGSVQAGRPGAVRRAAGQLARRLPRRLSRRLFPSQERPSA